MTFGAYIALIRDGLIVLALGFVLYKIYGAGEDKIKASDLKSLQTQIAEQAQTLAGWRQESSNANDQLSRDLATLHAPVPDKPPVWLCNGSSEPRSEVLPAPATSPDSAHPAPGGTDTGRGRDIRPQLEALKLKYETALAECRSVIAQWPAPAPELNAHLPHW